MPDKYGNNTKSENSANLEVPMTRKPNPKFSLGRDISKLVDPSADRTDGFSAKLDNPDKE